MVTAYAIWFLMFIPFVASIIIENGRGFWNIIHQGSTWTIQAMTMAVLGWLDYSTQEAKYKQAYDLSAGQEVLDLLKPTLKWFSRSDYVLAFAFILLIIYMFMGLLEPIFKEHKDAEGKHPTFSYIVWIIVTLVVGYTSVQAFLLFNVWSSGVDTSSFISNIVIPTATLLAIIILGGIIHKAIYGTLGKPRTWASNTAIDMKGDELATEVKTESKP